MTLKDLKLLTISASLLFPPLLGVKIPGEAVEEARQILNDSPWAVTQTTTRIISSVGSGVRGEKELHHRFFVRFLSARPVRQAYADLERIRLGYETLPTDQKAELDERFQNDIEEFPADWIVVAVTFRSSDARMEQRVWAALREGITETMQGRSFLSTQHHPRIGIVAFFPPEEPALGARFVFPRTINGEPVVHPEDHQIVFDLDLPGHLPELRVTFPVSRMIVKGELVL
jgi:hypothetical protein